MTKAQKGLVILLTPFLLGFIFGVLAGRLCSRAGDIEQASDIPELAPSVEPDLNEVVLPTATEVIYRRNRPPYSKWFADLNDLHLRVADSLGISVPKTRADINDRHLVLINDNKYYVVDELRHSVPYLTKGAAEELKTIAEAFSDSLKSKELLPYKLVVSSVLRTEEDVRRLRRSGNPNASDRSAHCYGTTFDITYTRYARDEETDEFMQPYELTKVLAEVLYDQKKAGRCIVKYERNEHCFHITSLVKR